MVRAPHCLEDGEAASRMVMRAMKRSAGAGGDGKPRTVAEDVKAKEVFPSWTLHATVAATNHDDV
jgi:hypothetical protein